MSSNAETSTDPETAPAPVEVNQVKLFLQLFLILIL
jgi:flagellar biogenesis protein FliO